MEILEYWIEHNQSKTYSIKLFNLFKEASSLISQYPNIGRPTDLPKIRIKTVRGYLMIYEELKEHIEILTIWNSRQDPKKLKKVLKKNT